MFPWCIFPWHWWKVAKWAFRCATFSRFLNRQPTAVMETLRGATRCVHAMFCPAWSAEGVPASVLWSALWIGPIALGSAAPFLAKWKVSAEAKTHREGVGNRKIEWWWMMIILLNLSSLSLCMFHKKSTLDPWHSQSFISGKSVLSWWTVHLCKFEDDEISGHPSEWEYWVIE